MHVDKVGPYIIGIALAIGSSQAVARGPGGTPTPQIDKVEMDIAQKQLLLKGKFFKPNATVVSLGSHRLEVAESSPTRVVASLPPHLDPATYRLLVSSSATHVNAASMYVQVPHKPASTYQVAGSALSLK